MLVYQRVLYHDLRSGTFPGMSLRDLLGGFMLKFLTLFGSLAYKIADYIYPFFVETHLFLLVIWPLQFFGWLRMPPELPQRTPSPSLDASPSTFRRQTTSIHPRILSPQKIDRV